ncbi:MAG: hypothetical protein IT323_02455, partial [Anaerolineae bacterium]|nr:hypothetical protein [Anaerolineae bacterium]
MTRNPSPVPPERNLPTMNAPGHPAAARWTARRSLPAGYGILRRLDLESPRTLLALGLFSVAMLAAGLVG